MHILLCLRAPDTAPMRSALGAAAWRRPRHSSACDYRHYLVPKKVIAVLQAPQAWCVKRHGRTEAGVPRLPLLPCTVQAKTAAEASLPEGWHTRQIRLKRDKLLFPKRGLSENAELGRPRTHRIT